ncbi:hypothetical protein AB0I30_27920 [Nocardia tengchongensis]|uniref:hypothetical protein n=1 Tax=Nocardia tengchongensis TaxID=2055889 RepID=UPI0033C0C356
MTRSTQDLAVWLGRIGYVARGMVVAVLIALGLIAFGMFSFLEARSRRTYGGIPV